ncbi:MAG: leucine-rich repeat domain-containing protein [Bacteroidales bacterium]|nr:leucine-rich repeat domain-containing protein [Bacteroidales bacterium]
MKTTLLTILLAATAALTAAAQSRPPSEPITPLTINSDQVIEKLRDLPAGNYSITIEGDLKDRLKWELDEDNKPVCKPELRWILPSDVFVYKLDISKTTGIDSIYAVNWIYKCDKDEAEPPSTTYVGELTLPDNLEYIDLEWPMVYWFCASENSRKFKSDNNFLLTKDGKTVLYYRIKGMKQKFVPEGVEVLPTNSIGIHYHDDFARKIRMNIFASFAKAIDSTGESTSQFKTEELDPKDGIIDLVLPKSLKRIEEKSITESGTSKGVHRWQIQISENVEYIHSSIFPFITAISPLNRHYTMEDGIIYDKKKTTVYYGQNFNGQLVLPKTVREIEDYAFERNTELSSITLPKKLKKIGYCAFRNSGIKEITLPKGLETIDAEAFYGTGILNVDIPGSVKKISRYAFGGYYCYAGDDTIKIKLNPGTETIDDYAFYYRDQGFNMIVTVPSTVKYIGSNTLSIGRNIYYSFEDTQNWHCAFNESDWKNRINGVPLTQIEFPDYIYSGIYSIDNTEYDKVSLDNAMLKLFTSVGIFFNIEQGYYDDEDNLTDSDVIDRLDYLYQPTYEDENAHKNDDFIFQYSVDSTDDDEQPCKLKIEILRPYFYKL